jgi:D-aspartate ligase
MTARPPSLPASFLRRVERASLPPAVVIGTDITGLSEARALASHGVPVIGVDEFPRRYTSYSSALTLVLCEDFHGDGVLELLSRIAEELPERPTLFLSMDEHVKLMAHRGREVTRRFRFEFPDTAAVDLLMSKQAFTDLAVREGWPVPRTFVARTADELEAHIAEMTFPVILKPQVKTLTFRTYSPSKAFRCANAATLRRDYSLIAQWEPEVVVQEWVPGGDAEIRFSFHYFGADLSEVCSFEGQKVRQWVPECGSTASALGVPTQRISALSREILTRAGCAGFGAVEYKRDPRTDSFYIMEPTVGRVNLQVGVAIANGVDIVSRAYFHLIGRAYPNGRRPTHTRLWVIASSDFRSARYYVRRGELTWASYLASIARPITLANWRPGDFGMLRGFLRTVVTRGPVVLARRMRRLFGRRTPRLDSRAAR